MIFIVLGTQKFQMNRLLMNIDGLVAEGKIADAVTAQIGHSDYEPENYRFQRFLDKAEFERLIVESEMIVTHGGVSTIITALKYSKPTIVCPRLAAYGEHVDDHQREIARAFAKKGFVLCCDDGDDLEERILSCKGRAFPQYTSQTNDITRIINSFLSDTITGR